MTAHDESPVLAPGTAEVEAMLRRHMAMYDWSKRETTAINDFILTVREGIAEDLARGIGNYARKVAAHSASVTLDDVAAPSSPERGA